MNDLTRQNSQLPDIPPSPELQALCRTAETLRVGDHFLSRSDLIKVSALDTDSQGDTIVRYDWI